MSNSSWTAPSFTTSVSGYYEIYAPAGKYTFIIWPPSDTNLINHESKDFVVDSDLTKDITLEYGVKISGYFSLPTGEKISGISTKLASNSGMFYSSGHWSTSGFYFISAPAGTYTLTAYYTSDYEIVYSESNIELNQDLVKDITLIEATISPTNLAILDVGQSWIYTVNATGGSGIFNAYIWYVNGAAKIAQSSPVFNFTPTTAGAYSITASVTDNRGAISYRTNIVYATVNPALFISDITVAQKKIDQGQLASLFVSDAKNGTGPYRYQWFVKGPNDENYSVITGATLTHYNFFTSTATTLGDWRFKVSVTDNATVPMVVTSPETLIQVNAIPRVSILPEAAILNSGSSITFNAITTGGSTPITYQWFLDDIPVGENIPSYTYTATSGRHTIYVKITDSASPFMDAISEKAAVTTKSALVAPAIIPSNNMINQGQLTELRSTEISGGFVPYTYQWFVKAPNEEFSLIPNAITRDYTFMTSYSTKPGTWSFKLNITDSSSIPVTVTSTEVIIIVNSAPKVTISPTSASLNSGQSKIFVANAINGSGDYVIYQWYINGVAQNGQTNKTFIHQFDNARINSITVTVTDSLGTTSEQSPISMVTVNPALIAPVLSSTQTILTQGEASTLTLPVTTGTPEYTFKWYLKAPQENTFSVITGLNSDSYNFRTTSTSEVGKWTFKVQVIDATDEVINSTETIITLNPAIKVTISPTNLDLYIGQNQLFEANANGGSGSYLSYRWFIDGNEVLDQNSSTFNYLAT
ncbi:MAG: hypothetical protein GX638_09110, partial [Crenarchaeota archaeon]|nr:hypothetical protein [Thermoproteota archaeon]